MSVYAQSGHISSAMSQTDLLVALYYGGILRYDPRDPKWSDRDRFILSKGQGGIGTYPILADCGFFPMSELENFAGRDNMLGVHAEWRIPGTEILSGSLGHGLPIATGMAEACRQDGRDSLIICFLGDGELYEGSNWEAAIFAGQQGLGNLVCIVDRNQQSCLGFTDERLNRRDGPGLNPIEDKFAAFNFETRTIDGHDYDQIFESMSDLRTRSWSRPLAIVANTVKGKGISIMENKRLWHYRVPQGADLEQARRDLGLPVEDA
jgi:transketolase